MNRLSLAAESGFAPSPLHMGVIQNVGFILSTIGNTQKCRWNVESIMSFFWGIQLVLTWDSYQLKLWLALCKVPQFCIHSFVLHPGKNEHFLNPRMEVDDFSMIFHFPPGGSNFEILPRRGAHLHSLKNVETPSAQRDAAQNHPTAPEGQAMKPPPETNGINSCFNDFKCIYCFFPKKYAFHQGVLKPNFGLKAFLRGKLSNHYGSISLRFEEWKSKCAI